VKSSKPGFDVVPGAQKAFGNTFTTSFWRLVETLDIPALGVVGKHPHHDRREIDVTEPFRYFIRSRKFLERFSPITEARHLPDDQELCSWKKRGPLGQAEMAIMDDKGDKHIFLLETFSNTHDVLTLITYVKPHGVLVAVPGRMVRV
jgi:hypothetical protein